MSKLSWGILCAGLAVILILQLIAVNIVYENWGWNKSYFGQHLFRPLLAAAFACCLAAPLLSRRPIPQRLVGLLLALISAVLVYFGSSLLIFLLYGA
jgi:hypothetical protein